MFNNWYLFTLQYFLYNLPNNISDMNSYNLINCAMISVLAVLYISPMDEVLLQDFETPALYPQNDKVHTLHTLLAY